MKVQVHERFSSGLPADDVHPYRTGPWRPQSVEYDAWDLDVEGEIPKDLGGVYVRNTENPLLPAVEFYHPFDGDGMLHSISFEAGEARYRNRFVPTDGFLAERTAGEALWAGAVEPPSLAKRADGWGAKPAMKDASSTDVVIHRGVALSSFWLCGDLYRHDPRTLEPLGKEEFGGRFPAEGVSAHPKVDENVGEMLFFNYSTAAPYMHYGVISAEGALAHYIDVPLPGPRLPHDMAFTENYAIVNDCPMFWEPEAMAAGYYLPRFFPELPTRFGIIPRKGATEEIRWFEAAPTYVLHWINAFEDGDSIVLDGFFQENPAPKPLRGIGFEKNLFRFLDTHTMRTRLHRWRFNLTTGETHEEQLSERTMEFGMINDRYRGRRYRYSYNALPVEGWFGLEGVVKHDLESGTEEVYQLPEGVFASETAMAPRSGGQSEDDGYLITFTTDVGRDRSECLILDAANPAAGPIARISLPERLSCGTHACWASNEDLLPA
ncbi:MAG: carotenoid oxygenase family protein [Deltaproteobacteria bacterium]